MNLKNGEEIRNSIRDIKEHAIPILKRVDAELGE